MSLKHDDLYTRAWEHDFEQPIFDAENNNVMPLSSHEKLVQSDFSTEEMRSAPETTHECSPKIFPQTAELNDVTDTYPDMKPEVETSS